MATGDVKENEMKNSADIIKVRGLDSAGDSIQSTVDQLTDKMRNATLKERGLLPAGLFENIGLKYLDPGTSLNLGAINGFVGVRNDYSWGGISLYWCSGGGTVLLATASYGIPQSITYADGEYVLNNLANNKRAFYIFVQNIKF